MLLLARQELGFGAFVLELGSVCMERVYGAFALFGRDTPVDELWLCHGVVCASCLITFLVATLLSRVCYLDCNISSLETEACTRYLNSMAAGCGTTSSDEAILTFDQNMR